MLGRSGKGERGRLFSIATHSSTLAWKIPWMEKPDRLQSMASQRVRHDSLSLLMLMSSFSFCLFKEFFII